MSHDHSIPSQAFHLDSLTSSRSNTDPSSSNPTQAKLSGLIDKALEKDGAILELDDSSQRGLFKVDRVSSSVEVESVSLDGSVSDVRVEQDPASPGLEEGQGVDYQGFGTKGDHDPNAVRGLSTTREGSVTPPTSQPVESQQEAKDSVPRVSDAIHLPPAEASLEATRLTAPAAIEDDFVPSGPLTSGKTFRPAERGATPFDAVPSCTESAPSASGKHQDGQAEPPPTTDQPKQDMGKTTTDSSVESSDTSPSLPNASALRGGRPTVSSASSSATSHQHKKFTSSLNVHKKFLEKSGTGVGPNGGIGNGTNPQGPGKTGQGRLFTTSSLSQHPRLVTGKIFPAGSPSSSSSTPVPGWGRGVTSTSAPNGITTSTPHSETHGFAARGTYPGLFLGGRGRGMTRGIPSSLSGRGRGVWSKISAGETLGPDNLASESEYPTAAEAARSKRLQAQALKAALQSRDAAVAASAAQAAATNAHLLEGLDAFRGIHLDPNASHWDEMADEDDDFYAEVVEFGDGTQYHITEQQQEADEALPTDPQGSILTTTPITVDNVQSEVISSPTPNKDERMLDEFDRQWPRRGGDAKSLFNERLGKFEPYAGRPTLPHQNFSREDGRKEILQRPRPTQPAVSPTRETKVPENPPQPSKAPALQHPTTTLSQSHAPSHHLGPQLQLPQHSAQSQHPQHSPAPSNHRGTFETRNIPDGLGGRELPPHLLARAAPSPRDPQFPRNTMTSRTSSIPPSISRPIESTALSQGGESLKETNPPDSRERPPHPKVDIATPQSHPPATPADPQLPESENRLHPPHATNDPASEIQTSEAAETATLQPMQELEELQQQKMMSAAERARKRRQEEEAARAVQRERAIQKAKELEIKLQGEKPSARDAENAEGGNPIHESSSPPWRPASVSQKSENTERAPIVLSRPKHSAPTSSTTLKSVPPNSQIGHKGALTLPNDPPKPNGVLPSCAQDKPATSKPPEESNWRRRITNSNVPENEPESPVRPVPLLRRPLHPPSGKDLQSSNALKEVAASAAQPTRDSSVSTPEGEVDDRSISKRWRAPTSQPKPPYKLPEVAALDSLMSRIKNVMEAEKAAEAEPTPKVASVPYSRILSRSDNEGGSIVMREDASGRFRPRLDRPSRPSIPITSEPNQDKPAGAVFEICSKPEQPPSPPSPDTPSVRFGGQAKSAKPVSPHQLEAFNNAQIPAKVNILSWAPPLAHLSPKTLSRDDLLFRKRFQKGSPITPVNLPTHRFEKVPHQTEEEGPSDVGTNAAPKPSATSNSRTKLEPTAKTRGRAMEHGSWRRQDPVPPAQTEQNSAQSKPMPSADVVQPTPTMPPETATAPLSNSLFESLPKPPPKQPTKSKLPEGTSVAFYRASKIKSGMDRNHSSQMFMVTSELDTDRHATPSAEIKNNQEEQSELGKYEADGNSEIQQHVKRASPAHTSKDVESRPDEKEHVETQSKFDVSIVPLSVAPEPADTIAQSTLPTPRSDSAVTQNDPDTTTKGSQSWTQPLSDPKIKSVWSQPSSHAATNSGNKTENSLKGISDPYPMGSLPSSVNELDVPDTQGEFQMSSQVHSPYPVHHQAPGHESRPTLPTAPPTTSSLTQYQPTSIPHAHYNPYIVASPPMMPMEHNVNHHHYSIPHPPQQPHQSQGHPSYAPRNLSPAPPSLVYQNSHNVAPGTPHSPYSVAPVSVANGIPPVGHSSSNLWVPPAVSGFSPTQTHQQQQAPPGLGQPHYQRPPTAVASPMPNYTTGMSQPFNHNIGPIGSQFAQANSARSNRPDPRRPEPYPSVQYQRLPVASSPFVQSPYPSSDSVAYHSAGHPSVHGMARGPSVNSMPALNQPIHQTNVSAHAYQAPAPPMSTSHPYGAVGRQVFGVNGITNGIGNMNYPRQRW